MAYLSGEVISSYNKTELSKMQLTCFVSTCLQYLVYCVCTVCYLIRTMSLASLRCVSHYYTLTVSQESPVFSEVHCLPIPIYQLLFVTLGRCKRITTQSMLLINHVSYWSTTEVLEPGSEQTRYCLCELLGN